MVSVITTVGIAQAVWQFSLQMLPYQFLLQGHDKLSNSVLWNSLNDISRFNFLMLLTIWLDRATNIEDTTQLSLKGDIDVELVLAVICPLHLLLLQQKIILRYLNSGRPHPCQLNLFNFLLASCHLLTSIWCCCSLLWCFGRFLQLNY